MLAKASSDKGALVVFEPSGVNDPRLFLEALSLSHVLKYSHEQMQDAGELLDRHNAPNLQLQIETLGAEGLRFRSFAPNALTRGWATRSAFAVKRVRDAAGAGDWFTAGVLHSLGQRGLKGLAAARIHDVEAAMAFGQALAAWTCGFEGARGGMYAVDKAQVLKEVRELVDDAPHTQFREHDEVCTADEMTEICALCARTPKPTERRSGAGRTK